jgi:hypothetical protein
VPGRERFVIRVLGVAVLAMLACSCFPTAAARADGRDFIPTPHENSLILEVTATQEKYETDIGGFQRAPSDLFVKERLTFISNGYSFHPRFIQYHLMLAAALKQETYRDDVQGTVSTNASGFDYDLRLNVLPEHPYKLKLFSSRTEPLYKQTFSLDEGAVSTRNGAVFSYRKKPYFLSVRYIDSGREWSRGTSDLALSGTNGVSYKELGGGRKLSFSASYDHVATSTSSGPGGIVENYGATNTIDLNPSSLQSSISGIRYRQDPEFGTLDSDGITWLERLNLKLPLNFKSLATYRYQKQDQTFGPTGAVDAQVRATSNRDYELALIHRLYHSLDTIYRFRRDLSSAAGGDTTSTLNSLDATYAKQVPHGTLLAGVHVSRVDADSSGRTTIASEAHDHLGLNEAFTTQQQQADCGSIRVFLVDHAAGDRPVAVDFQAVPAPGARCEIMVTGIPPEYDETAPHEYTISYLLDAGDYALRTDAYGYNASLSLFDNAVNPYYSRTVGSAKVLSGTYPGTPSDGSGWTAGVILGSLPWRLLGEFQQREGADAFRRWRGELDYNGTVTPTTNVALAAAYASTDYPAGSTGGSSQAYTDQVARFSANLQQRLFSRKLVLSAGGSYSSFQGLLQSSGFTLHANLQWKIGKTTVTAGANEYRSSRDDQVATDSMRTRQYYYLNVRREIF